MEQATAISHKANSMFLLRTLLLLSLSCFTVKLNVCSSGPVSSSLRTLPIKGNFSFDDLHHAAKDFGNRVRALPLAVFHPTSASDVATMVKHAWEMGPQSELTIAARGCGHSLLGQAQAHQGVVVKMQSLKRRITIGHENGEAYVDVSGGETWINILRETLRHGLTPVSWTDYLHLTVGGTLSNAGVSGQTFKHGPQISNVQRLEVVTGKGETVSCSMSRNEDLFHAVLGGLGQFGIITRARISVKRAPKTVKWVRVLYSNFVEFTEDQELLTSKKNTFDYIEGFVIINRTGLVNNWRSSFSPKDEAEANKFTSEGKKLFCLEVAKYSYSDNNEDVNKEVGALLSHLRHIPSTVFETEIKYLDFLDRVHSSEIQLREKGLWDVPHPWLNLFVPKSNIHKFSEEVFGKIMKDTSNGPVLLYPVRRSMWDNRTSVVIPEEEVFFMVAFLASAVEASTGTDGLEHVLRQNKRVLDFCKREKLGVKQYLPHFASQEEWKIHFGPRWESFAQRKMAYDPSALLAPGQRIFQKASLFTSVSRFSL